MEHTLHGPNLDLPAIEQRPTFLVHQINAELARVCNPLFKRFGVDLITSRILVILLEQPGIYVGDIVRLMALPQSTVSHQIRRLEEQALVRRMPDAHDKRVFLVHLTQRGAEAASACNRLSARIYESLFADVKPREMARLQKVLKAMANRLAACEPREFEAPAEAVT